VLLKCALKNNCMDGKIPARVSLMIKRIL